MSASGIVVEEDGRVWLSEFGSDALYFELLAWIEEPEDAAPIRSALNYAIHRECRARGLEMPHSQHDLYVKGPIQVQVGDGLATRVPKETMPLAGPPPSPPAS